MIALVITIVILIILATVSIYAVLGENGIIRKAEQARGVYEQAKANEEVGLDGLAQQIDDITFGYNDNTLAIRPKLTEGMTKVKYNSTNETWEKVIDNNQEWYNYGNKEWANVVLGDATFNTDGTLDESAPYTQLVWIPRYAYKITSMYHQYEEGAGNIEVVFIDTTNKGKNGTTYSTTYPAATIGGSMDDFVVHPAFEYGGQHLAGIWVGKFESSHTGCTTTKATGQEIYTGNEIMTIKAGVTSWRELYIGDMFETCLNMNRTGNPYGLNTNDNVVDPHLLKNDEWGAVAYLSKSSYGKENEEVYVNNNSNYITGIAGATEEAYPSTNATNTYKTAAGVKASTNGNVTGIYDMSGGACEYTAAYVNNGVNRLEIFGGNLTVEETAEKYRNVYESTVDDGSYSGEADYAISTPANGHYGDAVYETSKTITNIYTPSWYRDEASFPSGGFPFFGRGSYNGGLRSARGVRF